MASRRVPADVAAALGSLAAGAAVTVLVHRPGTRSLVQQVDHGWYDQVHRTNTPPREAAARIRRARLVSRHNPIAVAIVDRAEALAGDRSGLVPAAAALEAAGCRPPG